MNRTTKLLLVPSYASIVSPLEQLPQQFAFSLEPSSGMGVRSKTLSSKSTTSRPETYRSEPNSFEGNKPAHSTSSSNNIKPEHGKHEKSTSGVLAAASAINVSGTQTLYTE